MKLDDLKRKSVVIFGLGLEGLNAFEFIRETFPNKLIGLADQKSLSELDIEVREKILSGQNINLHLGADQLVHLSEYDVIIKSPGVPPGLFQIKQAVTSGKQVTSLTAIFFANFSGSIVGITGTKGKSTTASLTYAVLQSGGLDTYLVGNIGTPPLNFLRKAKPTTIFVYELSSHQLEGLRQSPHIAVLLNIVPEHLDYYENLEQYIQAKENITRYQSDRDYLVYNAMFPIPREIAAKTKAKRFPFSLEKPYYPGCFVSDSYITCSSEGGEVEEIIRTSDIPLIGEFNLHNVLAAISVGKLFGVTRDNINIAIRNFQSLEYRFELVGTYRGITFYNASIATVPEATIEHLKTLGDNVQTVFLGGYDRHLDFSLLASQILQSKVRILILFPTTGNRIWKAILGQWDRISALPKAFFVQNMEEAVRLAYTYTEPGKICLHSPASPSYGLFKNYKERGENFKYHVRKIGERGYSD